MKRSPEEQAQTDRLESSYSNLQLDVMLSIERSVCGCDYGGNSWTTCEDAQRMETMLGLRPGLRLLDVGAGSGWPGIYIADRSGCNLVLVDLPLVGLKIAAERAYEDQIAGTCWVACADAARMPFNDESFDALSHSDLLCCLRQKHTVLESCRRVTAKGGRMAFTVISIPENLSSEDKIRALEVTPEFVESETDYLALLKQTGWTILYNQDISLDYAASCRRQAKVEKDNKDSVIAVIGASDYADRQARGALKLVAFEDGLIRRDFFVATPT